MDKQIIMGLGDFNQIGSVYKKLDKTFYKLEKFSLNIEDKELIEQLDLIFRDLKDCIDGLGSAIK